MQRAASPKAMYSLDTTFVRNKTLPSGEVDGELVALDLDKGDCFGLDKIGTEIWHLAADPIALQAIIETLVERYAVDEASCERDLQPFLADMVAAGLLRIAG